MAKSHAPEGFPTFARFGSNVLVVWDDSDATADPYQHAAILLVCVPPHRRAAALVGLTGATVSLRRETPDIKCRTEIRVAGL